MIRTFRTFSNNRSEEEDTIPDDRLAEKTFSPSVSPASNLFLHRENAEKCVSRKNDIIINKTISTVRTAHNGNAKSVSVSVRKTNAGFNTLPKNERTTARPVPTIRRIARNIPTSTTGGKYKAEESMMSPSQCRSSSRINENCVNNNILTNSEYSDKITNNVDNLDKIQVPQIKSVKLLNNLNKLISKTFVAPVNEEDI